MNKINILILSIFYLLLNNAAYAFEQKLQNEESTELKPDTFLGALNTIVVTAYTLESDSESALDVSPACQKVGDGAFNSLNSRTSFCQKFEQTLDLYDAQGSYANTVNFTGYVYTEENNPTNTLIWPVKFKFRTTYTNLAGPLAHIAPRLECGTTDGVLDCQQLGGMPSVVLNPGLSPELTVQTNMNMNNRENSRHSFESLEIRANYNIVGQPIDVGSYYISSDKIPVVRCDVNQARANSSGCIFEKAPAVLRTINISIPEVDESALHIRDAQNSGLPGKFISEVDSIFPDKSLSKPLTRLRDWTARNNNRKHSLAICKAQDNSYSESCDPAGDPDDPEVSCQCDEYPFAATYQGGDALENPGVSVRRIEASDNKSAGARLGVFYTQQRILDGDEFYINVE
ncbi:NucA/NucB deoxyribonuclease domain-containing protein [Acinetobacter bereziniae]|uniref:NucA/NucB deoxyribonuclease domain-containing protein n=1 Tax=Acinetobacter bereziniae TaxID=106648 RepID=UPI0021D3C3E3|nr:NucA/NucB deoxyribonuclease domain-containing protein [Acinetobacter bereziniae]MCU4416070.1 hypothetical protein [Acinetobacter bereziniae]